MISLTLKAKEFTLQFGFLIFLFIFSWGTIQAQNTDSPSSQNNQTIEVMILGSFHFANPNQDVHNVETDDVLHPTRQKEIESIVDSLNEFNPTVIAGERTVDQRPKIDSLYQAFRNGQYELPRNEIYQLGFRLAKASNNQTLFPIDHSGDFPMKKVMSYAKKHDTSFVSFMQNFEGYVGKVDSLISNSDIPNALKKLNSKEYLKPQKEIYARSAAVGDTSNYVGANLVTQWYKRNLKIFTNLAQVVNPGDRVIVIFGVGHAPMLRRLVKNSPQMVLIEPSKYL